MYIQAVKSLVVKSLVALSIHLAIFKQHLASAVLYFPPYVLLLEQK